MFSPKRQTSEQSERVLYERARFASTRALPGICWFAVLLAVRVAAMLLRWQFGLPNHQTNKKTPTKQAVLQSTAADSIPAFTL